METPFLESGIIPIPIPIIIIILVMATVMVVICRRSGRTGSICSCVRAREVRVRIADGNRQLIAGSGEMTQ